MSEPKQTGRRLGHVAKRRRAKLAPQSPWTRRDKLGVCAVFVVGISAVFTISILRDMSDRRHSIDATLETWHQQIALSDDEVSKLRAIEFKFHCPDNLWGCPKHSDGEIHEHHLRLAGVLEGGHSELLLSKLER